MLFLLPAVLPACAADLTGGSCVAIDSLPQWAVVCLSVSFPAAACVHLGVFLHGALVLPQRW